MRGLNLKLTLSLIDKMTAPARKLQQRFAEAFSRMSQNLIAFGRNLEKVGKKMSQAGQWATMRITAPILGLGAASIRTAGQNEQLAISLEGIAGSAAEAEAYLQKLMKWGEKSPFDVADIVDAELALRNAGYGMDDAAERRRMLGEIAAGSKKSLMEVTSAYLDMRKAGKVGSSELHEMMKANIPVIKELSKMLGVSDQRIYQLAEDGKISFQQVRDAMRRMTAEGGVMHGKMQRYGRSIFGMFKDLGRSLSESLAGVGRAARDMRQIPVDQKLGLDGERLAVVDGNLMRHVRRDLDPARPFVRVHLGQQLGGGDVALRDRRPVRIEDAFGTEVLDHEQPLIEVDGGDFGGGKTRLAQNLRDGDEGRDRFGEMGDPAVGSAVADRRAVGPARRIHQDDRLAAGKRHGLVGARRGVAGEEAARRAGKAGVVEEGADG